MQSNDAETIDDKLVIAGAGSGKTTYIITSSTRENTRKILVTTFTRANEAEVRSKFVKHAGYIHHTLQCKHGLRFYCNMALDHFKVVDIRELSLAYHCQVARQLPI